ncbi:MAG TPA: glycosyltransferase family 39 protein [Gaiellaceae bacterium]|nr:glycosyltransferase family 39 protein [Gaiellaceae bacterium]
MPDEAIYAERALGVWQHGLLPLLHGQGAGYGVLYPVLAGIPLSIGAFTHGYALLKVLQALVVSATAVPVYLYGRRMMPQRYALAAAALTVASPLLLYSGLVMTEVLFYPLAAATLLAIAYAVETARRRDQVIAFALIAACVLTRVQAIVFLPVFAAAVLLDALLAHTTRRLRAFWAVWAITVLGGVVAVALPGLVGSYAGTLRGSYPVGLAIGLTYDHLAFLILTTGIVPVLALILLLLHPPANARALVVVTVSACVMILVQVGFFAARYSPHLLGRDLAALPPILFLTLMVWLTRERDPPIRMILCAFGVLCVVFLAPWNHLVSANALPDSFDLALLYRIGHPATVAAIGSLVVLTLAVVSRRLSVVAVLALLVASSVVASNEISSAVAANQRNIVGTPANWIDRAADGPVTYIYDGEQYWNSVWEERVWNSKLTRVVSIAPSSVPGPIPQSKASPAADGSLPIQTRWVVATDRLTFIGTRVAHLTQTGLDVSGLTLWHLAGPPRLATVETGVLPNGDMVGQAQVDVYGCQHGELQLTLLPKETSVLRVLFDGLPVLRADISGRDSWSGSVRARPESQPVQCRYTILGGPLLGSTRIAFAR